MYVDFCFTRTKIRMFQLIRQRSRFLFHQDPDQDVRLIRQRNGWRRYASRFLFHQDQHPGSGCLSWLGKETEMRPKASHITHFRLFPRPRISKSNISHLQFGEFRIYCYSLADFWFCPHTVLQLLTKGYHWYYQAVLSVLEVKTKSCTCLSGSPTHQHIALCKSENSSQYLRCWFIFG